MSGTGGLLAVHAHPDDETLATGALLATWSAAGLPVTVVTCTRGERGEVIPADVAQLEGDGPGLAAVRVGELAAALAALGVHDHVQLDEVGPGPSGRFADSGMVWADVAAAAAAPDRTPDAFVDVDVEVAARLLASVIADRGPDVVVGYEPGGGYGHPDHVHAHRVMHRAVDIAAGDDGPRPVVLWSVLPETALREGYAAVAALVDDSLRAPDPAGPTPSCAVPDDEVQVEVDVLPVRPALLAALRAHRTQVQAVREVDGLPGVVAVRALSDGVLGPVLARECYVLAPVTTGAVDPGTAWPAGVRCVAWPS